MAYPTVSDWDVIRGDSYERRVRYTPAEGVTSTDGWGVVMQVRRDTDAEVWLEKAPGDGLVLGVEDGKLVVTISIAPQDTRDWGRARWDGRWDLQFTSPTGRVRTPVGGAFRVFGDVTVVPGE